MRCPYCKSPNFIPSVAKENALNYGSDFFNIKCKKCKKYLRVYIARRAVVEDVFKNENSYADFSDNQMFGT